MERSLASNSSTGAEPPLQGGRHHQQQQQQQQHQSGNKPLSKSKSMEFLKAKLLSRKPSTKLQQQQQQQTTPSPPMTQLWDLRGGSPGRTGGGVQTTFFSAQAGPANQSAAQWGFQMDKKGSSSNGENSNHSSSSSSSQNKNISMNSSSGSSSSSNQHNMRRSEAEQREKDEYDWRQDTPFWNKQGRWARPAPAKKPAEEAWVNHQSPPMPTMAPPMPQPPQQMTMHHQQPHHPSNRIPGWPVGPSTQYPGVLLNRKLQGNFYPSFPVAGVSAALPSHNVYLPQVQVPSHFVAGQPSRSAYVSATGSGTSPAHSNSGSSSSGNNCRRPSSKTKLNPLRNNLDIDTNDDSLPSRLEITELSDEEPSAIILPPNGCPTPDYSTMPRSVSPVPSDNTVILVNQNGNNHNNSSSSSSNHQNSHSDLSRKILDMPSGLY